MTVERVLTYGLAALLITIGFFRPSNRLRARKIVENVLVGDVSGTVNQQHYDQAGAEPDRPAPPDRVGWAIATVGVLIATAQLVHDLLAK